MGDISIHSSYGDPRKLAAEANRRESSQLVHGLTPRTVESLNERFEKMLPQIVTSDPSFGRRQAFSNMLPEGATWDTHRTAQMTGSGVSSMGGWGSGGANSITQVQRPYQPEFESPDRQQYPVHRVLANRYWRLFHKLDPVIGSGVDLFAEMIWSKFDLTGVGVEGEIRDQMERMCEVTQLLAVLPYMIREFFVVGEVIPHCFFDSAEDIWTYIALHNPDQLEVIDAPFIKMDPVVEFVPDARLRQIVTSNDPKLQQVRNSIPPELIARLMSRQNIPLATDLNVTFIPRKLHFYDTRGTSILSRLWRILMYEDGIFNASIATARRHAGPLKVAKLGNAQTGWIPGPEHERRFMELVAQAEVDPHAWICYHYGLQLEAFGTTDRVMTINREWDIIERIKLVALGLSRAFLHGEVTYASASQGLQVFLRRLLSVRNFFESIWIYPKFFKPVSEINGWYRRDKSEIDHRIRIKRTSQQIREENRLIIPEIVWHNSLNPQVDEAIIRAYESLERLGLRISKGKKYAAINLDFATELESGIKEDILENQIRKKYEEQLGVDREKKTNFEEGNYSGPGEKEEQQRFPSRPDTEPSPNPFLSREPVQPEADEQLRPERVDSDLLQSAIWIGGKYGNWDYKEVEGLVDLLKYGNTNAAFWQQLLPKKGIVEVPDSLTGEVREVVKWVGYDPHRLLERGEQEEAWDQIAMFLDEQGYPSKDIKELNQILVSEGLLERRPHEVLEGFYESLPQESSEVSDDEFGSLFESALKNALSKKNGSNGKKARSDNGRPFDGATDSYLVGPASWNSVYKRSESLIGDLSEYKKGKSSNDPLAPAVFDAGHPHHQHCACNSTRHTAIETPEFEDPSNYASREDWQKDLHKSKIPQDAKKYIKQIENEVVDGSEATFESVWKEVEDRLDKGLPLDQSTLSEVVSSATRKLLRNIDQEALANAFTGLYSSGKEFSYKPTNFKKKKLDRLQKGSSRFAVIEKSAVTIDSLEDQRSLQNIKDTALEKLKSITDEDLRKSILEQLTSQELVGMNPLDLANRVVLEERRRRDKGVSPTDVEGRKELQQQLKDLYENQLWKLQRVMRTESINGFVIAQLSGFQEQGIQKVRWNAHRDDPKTCPLCRSLDGVEFEIDDMLKTGGRYPLSSYSHPNCRCFFSPIISHVTYDEYEKQLRDQPKSFQGTKPVYDSSQLDVGDIFRDVMTEVSNVKNAPVELHDSLKDISKNIADSPYKKYQPKEVEFVPDVYRTDEFRREVNPEENLAGQVVTWTDSNGKTFISNFATENTPVEDVLIRNWAQQVWKNEPKVRSKIESFYTRPPEALDVPSISPESARILQDALEPRVVGRTYYVGQVEAVALDKRFRSLSQTEAEKLLLQIGISKEDSKTISSRMSENPMWDIETGGTVTSAEQSSSTKLFVNSSASYSPNNLFQESLVSYMKEPHVLESKDPELYEYFKKDFFKGKEFGKK
jgi:SPP1 gp7 family putative phage head morphogenesis protein